MMGPEQAWAFDLDGFVVLPGLQSASAAATAACTAADGATLAGHPGLLAAIAGLAGGAMRLHHRAAYDGDPITMQDFHPIEHVLDRPPRRLPVAKPAEWATDTSVDERRRLGYDTLSRPDCVCVWGLRAVWALGTADSSVAVCPCTHKSNVQQPPTVARAEVLGAVERVALRPGDCLLAAATTLVAAAQGELLECVFADNSRSPQLAVSPFGSPAWHRGLTPAQMALVVPTRGLGHDGEPLRRADQLHHSLFAQNDRPDAPDRDEIWFWDTRGCEITGPPAAHPSCPLTSPLH